MENDNIEHRSFWEDPKKITFPQLKEPSSLERSPQLQKLEDISKGSTKMMDQINAAFNRCKKK